ncbi:MAG: fimbrillin family protein [Fermentimonas sp.]|nr:fimbrillin family protein [Fermentimonas sp.]
MLRESFFVRNERGLLITTTAIVILLMLSCTKGEIDISGENTEDADEVEATFNTTINSATTRASGTLWEAGDEIGLFAVTNGNSLSNASIYNRYKNIKYINNSAGATANLISSGNTIKFPGTKDTVDFRAYYPYSAIGTIGATSSEGTWGTGSGSDFELLIDVSQQSPCSAIDVMFAKAKGNNRDNPSVDLLFNHSLSQFILTVTAEEGISLEGTEIEIVNAVTQGTMNLNDGTVTPSAEVSGDTITPLVSYDAALNKITATAILIPDWDLSTAKVNLQTANGTEYYWKANEYQLLPNTRKGYDIKLTSETVEVVATGTTIGDWIDDFSETTEIIQPSDPAEGEPGSGDTGGGTGGGTSDNPYTVAQLIDSEPGLEVWVQGFIMGTAKPDGLNKISLHTETSDKNLNNENIVLADNIAETDTSKMAPIQFGDDNAGIEVQTQLNLVNNNDLIGREIVLKCTTGTAYSVKGGTNITEYELK